MTQTHTQLCPRCCNESVVTEYSDSSTESYCGECGYSSFVDPVASEPKVEIYSYAAYKYETKNGTFLGSLFHENDYELFKQNINSEITKVTISKFVNGKIEKEVL